MNKDGVTALLLATIKGHAEVVKVLWDGGANILNETLAEIGGRNVPRCRKVLFTEQIFRTSWYADFHFDKVILQSMVKCKDGVVTILASPDKLKQFLKREASRKSNEPLTERVEICL